MGLRYQQACLALGLALAGSCAWADGHGPAFALATPTLGEGQWSSDTAVMSDQSGSGTAVAYRELVGYGIGPDLQANLSVPLAQGNTPDDMSRSSEGMMGAGKDIEASVLWRFQRRAPQVGERYESSLLFSAWDSQDALVEGLPTGQGISAAAVTGHASRTTYWWLGGGIQHYFPKDSGQLGDLYYVTAVWGWRPPYFQHDYPAADWRMFVEAVGELSRRNELNGTELPDSGGKKLFAGPSVLGLFGAWGVEMGVLLPVSQSLNGNQPKDDYRAKAVFTYWF
ncbi:MAG TPA: hypothetical protein VH327_03460 [Gammaproteobacteria bacterium]|nr:hypothetical protein [Gammaproteobacteria bacterium]